MTVSARAPSPCFRFRRFRLAVLAGLGLLTASPPASAEGDAQSIGLLNFTARRVDSQQVQAFSRNLRETFLLDERFDLLDELEMYEGLAGREGPLQLRKARTLLAEGKKAYRIGHFQDALARLEEARGLHRQLYSELSRADELADLLLYQGLTLYQLKKPEAAQLAFLQMFLLDPAIDLKRAPQVPPEAVKLIDEARQLEQQTPLKGLSPTFASAIARKLEVAHLVTGVMEGSDEQAGPVGLTLQIRSATQTEPEATLMFDLGDLAGGVPPAGAPIYRKIVGLSERVLLEPR